MLLPRALLPRALLLLLLPLLLLLLLRLLLRLLLLLLLLLLLRSLRLLRLLWLRLRAVRLLRGSSSGVWALLRSCSLRLRWRFDWMRRDRRAGLRGRWSLDHIWAWDVTDGRSSHPDAGVNSSACGESALGLA